MSGGKCPILNDSDAAGDSDTGRNVSRGFLCTAEEIYGVDCLRITTGVASCFLTFIIQRSFTLSLQYRPKFSPASTHCAVYIIRVAYSLHFLTDTLQSPVRSSGTLFLQSSVFAVWLLTGDVFPTRTAHILGLLSCTVQMHSSSSSSSLSPRKLSRGIM